MLITTTPFVSSIVETLIRRARLNGVSTSALCAEVYPELVDGLDTNGIK